MSSRAPAGGRGSRVNEERIRGREILLLLWVAARIVLPILGLLILTVTLGYGLFMLVFG